MANDFLSVMYDMDYYNLTTNFTKVAADFIQNNYNYCYSQFILFQSNYNPTYSQLCLLLITLYCVLKLRNMDSCVQELTERLNYLEQSLVSSDEDETDDETKVDKTKVDNKTSNVEDRMTDLENAVKNLNSCVSTLLIDSIESTDDENGNGNGNDENDENEEGFNGENRYETKYEQKDEDYVPETESEDEE